MIMLLIYLACYMVVIYLRLVVLIWICLSTPGNIDYLLTGCQRVFLILMLYLCISKEVIKMAWTVEQKEKLFKSVFGSFDSDSFGFAGFFRRF